MSYIHMAESPPSCPIRADTHVHSCIWPSAHMRHSPDASGLAGAQADSAASFHARELLQEGSMSLFFLVSHHKLRLCFTASLLPLTRECSSLLGFPLYRARMHA